MALVAVSAFIGSLGVRFARSTSDFLVASRTVGPAANASAISGEYLSAASFLGVAGLILRDGADALWYPVGFTAGYLALVLFVRRRCAAPARTRCPTSPRPGCASPALRRVCTVFVLRHRLAVPAAAAAGRRADRSPSSRTCPRGRAPWRRWSSCVATVVVGGMRSITFVQAFQYWLKLTALAVPAVVVLDLVPRPAAAPRPRRRRRRSPTRPPSTSGPTWCCR